MANLLPTKELRSLTHERRLRLYEAVLILLAGVSIFGTLLLAPAAVALFGARGSGLERLETTRKLVSLQEGAGAGATIAATKEKMQILKRYGDAIEPHELVERIMVLLPSGISLRSLAFARESESVALELTGGAKTRTALITFGDALRQSGLFTEVNIPIESLARNTNLEFKLLLLLTDTAR